MGSSSDPRAEGVRADAIASQAATGIGDRVVNGLVRGYFTKTNLLLHALIYPVLMACERGDFHLFLDGISIEAVFVGLLVGISTKTILAQHHGLKEFVRAALHHKRPEGPHV